MVDQWRPLVPLPARLGAPGGADQSTFLVQVLLIARRGGGVRCRGTRERLDFGDLAHNLSLGQLRHERVSRFDVLGLVQGLSLTLQCGDGVSSLKRS